MSESHIMSYDNIFLAAFLLLLLAVLTIEACRRDHVAFADNIKTYLFRGRRPIHSLASNIGATFSVTYFFGAIVIYAQLFHSWFVLTLAFAFPAIFALYDRLLRRAEKELDPEAMLKQRGNILLDLLAKAYPPKSFQVISAVYLVIYFGLLVEELAVSRLILSSLMPGRPIVVSFLLSVICLVVVVYLHFGGFRAVLISDFVQGAVLCSFFVTLILFIFRYGTMERLADFPLDSPAIRFSNLFLVLLLAVVWFLAGIDYSSRFNFDAKTTRELFSKRRQLASLTAFFTFVTLSLGIFFSQALSDKIPTRTLPVNYVRALAVFFLDESAPIYRIVFLMSVYCMIFTTIDTLLVTLLQVASYKRESFVKKAFLTRDKILRLLLVAAVVSSIVNENRVHTTGIFIASLLIIPAVASAKCIFPRAASWLPTDTRYMWWTLTITAVAFFLLEPHFLYRFEYHFLMPGVTFVATLVVVLIVKIGSTMMPRGEP